MKSFPPGRCSSAGCSLAGGAGWVSAPPSARCHQAVHSSTDSTTLHQSCWTVNSRALPALPPGYSSPSLAVNQKHLAQFLKIQIPRAPPWPVLIQVGWARAQGSVYLTSPRCPSDPERVCSRVCTRSRSHLALAVSLLLGSRQPSFHSWS